MKSPLESALADTQAAVTRLLRENRALKAQNQKLTAELARWDELRALVRKLSPAKRGR